MTVDQLARTAENESITLRTTAGASLVQLVGDMDLDVVARLRTTLGVAMAAHCWLIVDLSRVRHVDSVALNALVQAGLTARRNGGDLLVAAPPAALRAVLRSARLATVFLVYDTVPQAMTAALLGRSATREPVVPPRQRHEAHR